MLKTKLEKQTFTSQADGTKFTDHLTFEIIEDKDKDNHQIKISMISQFDIVEFVCSMSKFSEAVQVERQQPKSKINHTEHSYSLQQQVEELAEAFRLTTWEN